MWFGDLPCCCADRKQCEGAEASQSKGEFPRCPESPFKTQEQKTMIRMVVQKSDVFSHIAEGHVNMVCEAFRGPIKVRNGAVVIQQGQMTTSGGPGLFLLESGAVDVYVHKAAEEPPGVKVFTYDKQGQTFGESALFFDCCRTATVMATCDTVLWHIDRDTFQLGLDRDQLQRIIVNHERRLTKVGIEPRGVTPGISLFDIDLTDESRQEGLKRYFRLCKESTDLFVTLSCFAVWNKHKKLNSHGKVVPAVPINSAENVRIFFFDDNIDWAGKEQSPGICNLRDVQTGEFVEYADGDNGFTRRAEATNTIIHYSSKYSNVLVQANILDAMEDEYYFTKIVEKYSKPGEKLIIIMDVNSTIICVDSMTHKDMTQMVLSNMFEFISIEPREEFDFEWNGCEVVKIDKRMSLKQLLKKIAKDDKKWYESFYTYKNCAKLVEETSKLARVCWSNNNNPFSLEAFSKEFDRYCVSLVGSTTNDGITNSWFRCYKAFNASHCLLLNSFGTDTRKVVVNTVADERQVLNLAVSYKHWSPKDVQAFEKMFGVSFSTNE